MKNRRALKAAGVALGTGLIVSETFQEIKAYFDTDQQGIFEGHDAHAVSRTPLAEAIQMRISPASM